MYKLKIFNRFIFVALLSFFAIQLAANTVCKWAGYADSDWNNPCNWDARGVPDNNDLVTIPEASNDPEIASSTTLKNVTVKDGGHLTIASEDELHLEDGQLYTMFIEEGTVVNNNGFQSSNGDEGLTSGVSFAGTLNDYDSIGISQHVFGGILVAGTLNMYSGHANVFINEIYNVKVGEGGTLNVDPSATLSNVHAGPADDVGLINSGTISNDGTFESVSIFETPTPSAIENEGEIINNGFFKTGAWVIADKALVNHGQVSNTGSFIIESSVVESPFLRSNQGSIINAPEGTFDIIGFEKTFCLPGVCLLKWHIKTLGIFELVLMH